MGCNRLGTAEDKKAVEKAAEVASLQCQAPDCSGAEVQAAYDRGGESAVRALQAQKTADRRDVDARAESARLAASARIETARREAARSEAAQIAPVHAARAQAAETAKAEVARASAIRAEIAHAEADRANAARQATVRAETERAAKAEAAHDAARAQVVNAETDRAATKRDAWKQTVAKRLLDGRIAISSEVGPPPSKGGTSRQHFERQLFPGIEVGLEGWERCHSQGAITGNESAEAIRYAPREVNRAFQQHGVEKWIHDAHEVASDLGGNVLMHTVTELHPLSLRLKSIEYRVEIIVPGSPPRCMFEAELTVSDDKKNPSVGVSVAPGGQWDAGR